MAMNGTQRRLVKIKLASIPLALPRRAYSSFNPESCMARAANFDLQAYVYLAQQDPSGWTWELDSKWSSYRRELCKLLTGTIFSG